MTNVRNVELLESSETLTKPTMRPDNDLIISLFKQHKINIATADKLAYQTIGREKHQTQHLSEVKATNARTAKQTETTKIKSKERIHKTNPKN